MGGKGKKTGKKGSPSPQGAQASPPPVAGKEGRAAAGSSADLPRSDLPADKTPKKQKSSPPTKTSRETETGKTRNQPNGRDSPERSKKTGKQREKTSQGAAAAKSERGCCSFRCLFLLSILVAVVAVAGYVAHNTYPAESEHLIGELDVHLQRVIRSVNEFVSVNLDKIRNADSKSTDEQSSEPRKSTDDEAVESTHHAEESSEEDEDEPDADGEQKGRVTEEFDAAEPPVHAERAVKLEEGKEVEKVVDDDVEVVPDVEPEIVEEVLENEVEHKSEETEVEDDDAEFVEKANNELEEDAGRQDDAVLHEEVPEHLDSAKEEEIDHEEDRLKHEHLDDVVEQKFEETEIEDDSTEFEEQVDESSEQDVDQSTESDDVTRWEMADEGQGDATEESEKSFDGTVGDGREAEQLRSEEVVEQFETPEVQVISDDTEQVSEQESSHEPHIIQEETRPLEPATQTVSSSEAISVDEGAQEVPVQETSPEIPLEEPTIYEEIQDFPALEVPEPVKLEELSEQEVPLEEIHEEVLPVEELPPQGITPTQEEPESQIPTDIPEHEVLVEEPETNRDQLQPERVPDSLPVETDLDEVVDSVPTFEGDDSKSSEEINEPRVAEDEQDKGQEEVKLGQQLGGEASNDASGKANDDAPGVTDTAEIQLEKELNYIDGLINTAPREAIEKFDHILQIFPLSPRATIGKARALGVLSDVEQNDGLLEQSIAEYLRVFALPAVPKSLMVEVGRECAQRQTIRGWGSAAAQTLHSLVNMYPDDLVLYNELGQKYLVNGAYNEARAVFTEILKRDPSDAFAMLYLGFIMKAVDNELSQSLDFMKTGLVTVPVSDIKFYIELGEAFTKANRHHEALEVYQLATDRGLLKSVWQRSWLNVADLRAQPWWAPAQTNNLINLQVLEDFRETIREEASNILANKSSLFLVDNSDFVKTGELKHMRLFINGRKVTENCDAAVKTCSLLDAFSDAIDCRQCEVKFSLLQSGLHLRPHCGPTNCRLTAHLPLTVASGARIRIADETRTYNGSSLLIFDDSFEQELWVIGETSQLLLSVEMWHPDLSFEQKSTLGPL